jgi:nitrite reductase/ring-hydroxylating ferredoxin subunit
MTPNKGRRCVVSLSSAVPAGVPVRVVHGNDEFVLFREADGHCRALVDRCAHRRAALSGGRITEQFVLECPYHGWRYDGASGACIAIPNLRPDEKIPKNYRVQSFETSERDGFIQLLLGSDDSAAEPLDMALPNLDRQWEGERYLAYSQALFMETLVDCPSALLKIHGLQIQDDHPIGDPVVTPNRVSIEYAMSKARKVSRLPKRVVADYPYTLNISASRSAARVTLNDNDTATLCATALLVAVPIGARLTRALWRGAAIESLISSLTIECREHIDPGPVRASNNVVSRIWARTSMAATTELS